MGLQQAHPEAGRTLLDWLPMAMTLSRLRMYSQRANSIVQLRISKRGKIAAALWQV